MEKQFTAHDLFRKLIGPIQPAGATHVDEKRYGNLEELTEATDTILSDIRDVARQKDRPEYSMKKAGKHADTFLRSVRDWLNEHFEEAES
jgi:hypothetical protein